MEIGTGVKKLVSGIGGLSVLGEKGLRLVHQMLPPRASDDINNGPLIGDVRQAKPYADRDRVSGQRMSRLVVAERAAGRAVLHYTGIFRRRSDFDFIAISCDVLPDGSISSFGWLPSSRVLCRISEMVTLRLHIFADIPSR